MSATPVPSPHRTYFMNGNNLSHSADVAALKLSLAQAVGRAGKRFAIGYSLNTALSLVQYLLRFGRRKGDGASRETLRALLLNKESACLGSFMAIFGLVYHGMKNVLVRTGASPDPDAISTSAIAGAAAGMSIHALSPAVGTHLDPTALALHTLVRAVQALARQDEDALIRASHPALVQHADSLIFILSCALIMYCWFYHPEALSPAYRHWITTMAQMDTRLLDALRSLKEGRVTYGHYDDCLKDYALRHGCNPDDCNFVNKQPIPCSVIHPLDGDHCSLNVGRRAGRGFLGALSMYVPVHVIAQLLVHRRELIGGSAAASSTIGTGSSGGGSGGADTKQVPQEQWSVYGRFLFALKQLQLLYSHVQMWSSNPPPKRSDSSGATSTAADGSSGTASSSEESELFMVDHVIEHEGRQPATAAAFSTAAAVPGAAALTDAATTAAERRRGGRAGNSRLQVLAGCLARAGVASVRSSAFLAVFIGLAWAGVCTTRNVLQDDRTVGPALGSALTGFSIFVESPHRRAELAAYVAPRALQSAWQRLEKCGWVRPFPGSYVTLFSLASALLMVAYEKSLQEVKAEAALRSAAASAAPSPPGSPATANATSAANTSNNPAANGQTSSATTTLPPRTKRISPTLSAIVDLFIN